MRMRLFWSLCLLGLASLLFSTWLGVERANERYEAMIRSIRAAGEPLTEADFARRHPEPDRDHDFGAFMAGLPERHDPPDLADLRCPTNRQPLGTEILSQLREVVVSNAPAIDEVLATDLSGFSLAHGWKAGFAGVQDEVHYRISLNKLLAVQAVYEAEIGNHDRAVVALERGFQIAHLRSPMALVGGIVQVACEAMVLPSVQRTVNRVPLTDAELRRLERVLSRRSNVLVDALLTERAFHTWWCTDIPAAIQGEMPGKARGPLSGWVRMLPTSATQAKGLQRFGDRLIASRLPARERLQAFAALETARTNRPGQTQSEISVLLQNLSLDYHVSRKIDARWVPFVLSDLRGQAGLANARAAVALERWRLAHSGRLPDSLSELVPEYLPTVPEDPFDHTHGIRYARRPGGYVVYSVGPDFVDDGGRECWPGDALGCDVTFVREDIPTP